MEVDIGEFKVDKEPKSFLEEVREVSLQIRDFIEKNAPECRIGFLNPRWGLSASLANGDPKWTHNGPKRTRNGPKRTRNGPRSSSLGCDGQGVCRDGGGGLQGKKKITTIRLIRADFWEGDATKHFSVKKRGVQWKGGGNSVNQGFGKDFYRKGKSVKRFGPFTKPPDSENIKVAVLIPCPKIRSYLSRKCAINTFWTQKSAGLLGWGSRGSRQIIYVRIFPNIGSVFGTANLPNINSFRNRQPA